MTKREHINSALNNLISIATDVAAATDTALDDAVVVRINQALQVGFVRDFIIERILAVLGGDNSEAQASPEVAEQLNALNLGFGDLAKFISVAVQLFKLLKDSGLLGK